MRRQNTCIRGSYVNFRSSWKNFSFESICVISTLRFKWEIVWLNLVTLLSFSHNHLCIISKSYPPSLYEELYFPHEELRSWSFLLHLLAFSVCSLFSVLLLNPPVVGSIWASRLRENSITHTWTYAVSYGDSLEHKPVIKVSSSAVTYGTPSFHFVVFLSSNESLQIL